MTNKDETSTNKGRFKPKLTDAQVEYIKVHYVDETDEEIAKKFSVHPMTIYNKRKKLGLTKEMLHGDSSEKTRTMKSIKAGIADDEIQVRFYKEQFANSLYYEVLKDSLTPDEIKFYLEEWASLCIQFSDIIATEKRQLSELIIAEIMGNRILRNIKITEEEITSLAERVEALRKSTDVENDEAAQQLDQMLITYIRTMGAQTSAMSNDYQKNVDLRNNLLRELNARRADRAEQISKKGTTFMSIVDDLRKIEVRRDQGRQAELLRIAKESKAKKWREPILMPDGSMDCVLVDEFTNFPKGPTVVREEDNAKANGISETGSDNDDAGRSKPVSDSGTDGN